MISVVAVDTLAIYRRKAMEKKRNKNTVWIFLLGAVVSVAAYASNPASTDYVAEKIAILQAEINQILNGG